MTVIRIVVPAITGLRITTLVDDKLLDLFPIALEVVRSDNVDTYSTFPILPSGEVLKKFVWRLPDGRYETREGDCPITEGEVMSFLRRMELRVV